MWIVYEKKGDRQVNILKHLSKFLLNISKIYTSFIKSNFLYCSNVWYFCGLTNMRKILNIEKKCLPFICYDFECNYETLLQLNKLEGLQIILLKHF